MKATLYSSSGKEKGQVELPGIFTANIRQDIVNKYAESEKFLQRQRYSAYTEAGKRHSASGTISHLRHSWKGHYGKGISRLPRKTMSRRGKEFYWVGAEVSSARGGRMAHPPKGLYAYRKINNKEKKLALSIAYSATFNPIIIKQRYALSNNLQSSIIESLPSKTKELHAALQNIFGNEAKVWKEKSMRSGKGKRRGRKYKSNAGLLIITGSKESARISGIQVKPLSQVSILDLYPLGRLTLYTQQALKELGEQNAL